MDLLSADEYKNIVDIKYAQKNTNLNISLLIQDINAPNMK